MQNFPFLFLGQKEARNNVSLCSRYKRNYFTIKKIANFQKAKNDNFPKGLTHDLWQKNSKFSFTFFYGKMGLEIMFYDVLDKKETILEQKK